MCKFCEEGKEKLLPLDYANTDFSLMTWRIYEKN